MGTTRATNLQYVYGFGAQGPPLCGNAIGATTRTVSAAGIAVSGVTMNGSTTPLFVAPGSTVTIVLNYAIPNPRSFSQAEIGYATNTAYSSCTQISYSESGAVSPTLTAPATPGTYDVAVDRGQDTGCGRNTSNFWHGHPDISCTNAVLVVSYAPQRILRCGR